MANNDKAYMLYGSTMRAIQGNVIINTDEEQVKFFKMLDHIWAWAKVASSQMPAASANGQTTEFKKAVMLVNEIAMVKSGMGKNGKPYTIHNVIDADGKKYGTFAGTRFEVGKAYEIEYSEQQNGEYTNYRINDRKDPVLVTVGDPSDDTDVPF